MNQDQIVTVNSAQFSACRTENTWHTEEEVGLRDTAKSCIMQYKKKQQKSAPKVNNPICHDINNALVCLKLE